MNGRQVRNEHTHNTFQPCDQMAEADKNLQEFQGRPSLWDDDTDIDDDHRTTSSSTTKLSWPLVSFENTVQNVCCISFILGSIFTFNLQSLLNQQQSVSYNTTWIGLNVYLIFFTVFHLLEFLVTAIWNPTRVTVDAFLLNNGWSYHFAQIFCVLEYVFSMTCVSEHNLVNYHHRLLKRTGLVLILIGQFIRTQAMITAAQSFNHKVSTHARKQSDHVLVTQGIYGWCRHPSYFGFFWWTLGIQLFLGNWICLGLFSIVLWRFFNTRIKSEEKHLIKFFGKAYEDYKRATPTWIPFIA